MTRIGLGLVLCFTLVFSALTGIAGAPASAAASNGPLGATVNPSAFANCNGDYICAANAWDGFVADNSGSGQQALSAQKWYYTPGELPTTLSPQLINLHTHGTFLFISFKPSQTFSAGEDQTFRASLQAHIAALGTGNFRVILWQEPNAQGQFPSASAYRSYVAHYAPIALSLGLSTVYDPALCAQADHCNAQSVVDYYPGDQYVNSSVLLDYYCSAFVAGATITSAIENLANNHSPHPLRLGLGEWGASANGSTPTLTQWNNYTSYLDNFFTGRNTRGFVNAAIMYFNGPAGQTNNNVSGPGDYKVPAIQHMADIGL